MLWVTGILERKNNDESEECRDAEYNAGEFAIGKERIFVVGSILKSEEGETAKENGWEKERTEGKDERRESKEEKEEAPDDLLAPLGTEEDWDSVDLISPITLDIFEVFDGDGEKIGDKEVGEE